MTTKHVISNFAILAVIAGVVSSDATAAVRAGNKSRTYADAYNQVNELATPRVGMTGNVVASDNTTTVATSTDVADLPIRVANANLASRIARGDASAGVTVDDLTRCSMVYPGGEFAWDKPNAGIEHGKPAQCVAVVEMRASGAAADGSDLVLARANVASGDSVRCNISDFPEAGYTDAISDFVFPADRAPTMDDVIKVMNAEQKQNAGFKIAASAVVGALGGNIAGKNDVGKDGLLGTDKGKIQGSVIGALAGAAVGAGSAYGGKVGGDVIMSTGVNAAAGGIMGNVLASGDSVLRIEDCEVDNGRHTTCLWGYVMNAGKIERDKYTYYFNISSEDGTTYQCENDGKKECTQVSLVNIKLAEYPDKDIHEAFVAKYAKIIEKGAVYHLETDPIGGYKKMLNGGEEGNTYAIISDAGTMDKQYAAMIPDVKDSTFGLKEADWRKIKNDPKTGKPVGRGANGKQIELPKAKGDYDVDNFYPIYRSADDGGIVDFGNKARLKATLTGAGVGGALGAFSGYQGAQSDINERWVTAAREYEDSLGKVYCITGSRYLTRYNDVVTILEMP